MVEKILNPNTGRYIDPNGRVAKSLKSPRSRRVAKRCPKGFRIYRKDGKEYCEPSFKNLTQLKKWKLSAEDVRLLIEEYNIDDANVERKIKNATYKPRVTLDFWSTDKNDYYYTASRDPKDMMYKQMKARIDAYLKYGDEI